MGIDHRGLNALMAEKFLNFPDIDASHEQVSSETVPQGMDGSVLHNPCFFNRLSYSVLNALVADMMGLSCAMG